MPRGARLPGLNLFGQTFQILDKAFAASTVRVGSEIGPGAIPSGLLSKFVRLFQVLNSQHRAIIGG
jgi:hypothetical protein